MPGRGSYGPGGKWIHDRAHRIMEEGDTQGQYGDKQGKQVAYAIATQQAHKLGKTPKKKGGYGTKAGRSEAKAKFDQPKKMYQKTASQAGQDLKTPFQGMNTKFPTDDSKGFASKQLAGSKKSSEVGPTPSTDSLTPKGPSVQDVTPKMATTKGSLPKLGSDARYANDPLVVYLSKHAEQLDNNEGYMLEQKDDPELASADTSPSGRGMKDTKDALDSLFDNKGGFSYKYLEHNRKP